MARRSGSRASAPSRSAANGPGRRQPAHRRAHGGSLDADPPFRRGSAAAAGRALSFAAAVAARESQIVLGLDPDPANLWPAAARVAERATGSAAERAGAAVLEQCRLLIDAAGPACVATKPQLACFERLGAPGWAALQQAVELSHEAGLLVIADGKRGDVPVTAAAYAQALAGVTPTAAGEVSGLRADAFTANPLLGADALAPLIATGATVFLLVRTSNPGAADVQDLAMADGRPLWEHLALLADRLGTGAVLVRPRPGTLRARGS